MSGKKIRAGAVHGSTGRSPDAIESVAATGHTLAVNAGGAPGTPVTPQVAAADQSFVLLNPVAEVIGFRVAFNSADDAEANDRLVTGDENASQAGTEQRIVQYFDTPIARIDVVGLADVAVSSPAGNCMNVEGDSVDSDATKVRFDFPTAVTKVVVSCLPSWASGVKSQLHIQGFTF